jgi:hypothetical protein
MDSHLANCPNCRATACDYNEVIRLARSLPPPAPSSGVERRLRDLIARVLAPRRLLTTSPDDTQTEIPLS